MAALPGRLPSTPPGRGVFVCRGSNVASLVYEILDVCGIEPDRTTDPDAWERPRVRQARDGPLRNTETLRRLKRGEQRAVPGGWRSLFEHVRI
jgi:hypothetical protein